MANPAIRSKSFLIHLGLWIFYILLEYIANLPYINSGEHWLFLRSVLLSLPVLIIPTYLIVWFAVPRWLMANQIVYFSLFALLMAVVVLFGRVKWLEFVNFINYDYLGSMPITKVLKNVIRDYAVIALAVSLYIIGDWRKKDTENLKLTEVKAMAELELLKRQLHPHFLFNTLNNIYSLALKQLDPSDQAVQSILKLSRLMEYLVYQSGEEQVALAEEIGLIKNYIDLEKLRHGKHLEVLIETDEVDESLKTAPLILLPFVENCFKHGGKNEKGIFWIKISIRVYERRLIFFVSNSKPKNKGKLRNGGTGLKNIAERLDLLYAGDYKMQIADNEDFFSVNLEFSRT